CAVARTKTQPHHARFLAGTAALRSTRQQQRARLPAKRRATRVLRDEAGLFEIPGRRVWSCNNKVRSRNGRRSIDPGFPTKVGGRHMSEPTSPARDSSLKDR